MDYICYRRKLGEVEVRKFIRQIVSAVHYLHQGGILHRFVRKIYLTFWSQLNWRVQKFLLNLQQTTIKQKSA